MSVGFLRAHCRDVRKNKNDGVGSIAFDDFASVLSSAAQSRISVARVGSPLPQNPVRPLTRLKASLHDLIMGARSSSSCANVLLADPRVRGYANDQETSEEVEAGVCCGIERSRESTALTDKARSSGWLRFLRRRRSRAHFRVCCACICSVA